MGPTENLILDERRRELISKEMEVALQVYDLQEKYMKTVTVTLLKEVLEKHLTPTEIGQALDRLYDQGIIYYGLKKVEDKWKKPIKFTQEGKPFIENIYNEVVEILEENN